ncbi:hypothetical protein GCM10009541_16340 [Micromonospora gifhornensis]|uniref:DUF3558 domain-containing protein n=1 Tax=Micromonospora gifhornensis TaxID=84594 RepID=A0ABQ4IF75_9ACTN|nr:MULTISPECIES: DUF3558 family protein [Micromonospora]GIJ16476.1 hypothetical protein Vgi01_31600 [Micromonospora gifhornensis]
MRHLTSVARLAAAATVLTVLAACGGTEPAAAPPAPAQPSEPAPPTEATEAPEPPAAAPVDACALVSKEDAEKLAGTPLDDPLPSGETCWFTGPVSGPVAQVEVHVGDGAKKILDIDRDLKHEFETLSGIGDEAYLEEGMVFVNVSGVWVAIRLVRTDDMAKYDERLTELARTVAGRL